MPALPPMSTAHPAQGFGERDGGGCRPLVTEVTTMAIDYSGQDWRLEDDRLADPCGDEAEADSAEDVEEFEYDLEWDDDEQAAQYDA